MKPTMRVKFALLTLASLFTAAFAWSAAQGQFRTPRPPIIRPPSMNPNRPGINPPGMPAVGPSTTVWKCPKCGYEYRGAVPPSTCPGCKAQMSNGMGNGIPGPGGMVNPNPVGPVTPPGINMNPPVVNMNPPVVNANPPVVNANPPVVNPVSNLADSSSPSPAASSSSSSGTTRNWKMISLVIGVIVIGVCVLLGGTFLVIYTMKSSSPKPRRRRRRRDDDNDDRD